MAVRKKNGNLVFVLFPKDTRYEYHRMVGSWADIIWCCPFGVAPLKIKSIICFERHNLLQYTCETEPDN